MTDAPERIWALPDCFSNADQDNTEDWTCGDWDTTDNPRSVEYIRADLADRQTQEAVAAVLMEAAGKVNDACDGSLSLESRSDENCAYDDGVRESCAAAIHAILALIPDERADR